MDEPAIRTVRATAPVRVCDLGGWTDTWFAGHGRVCNIAVGPGVEVDAVARPRRPGIPPLEMHVASFGDRYGYDPDHGAPGRHPLLEAAVAEVGLPAGTAVRIGLRSGVPPGSATGTSAAVVVALVGVLLALRSPEPTAALTVARVAHAVETVRLGRQSGVQDHLAAAHGGISDIRIDRYPDATVTPVDPGPVAWDALQARLAVVGLGAHDSSAVHRAVVAGLGAAGAPAVDALLEPLRHAAARGADALRRGDLDALGDAMTANTRAQAALHPLLVSAAAHRVVEVARAHGAVGVKVNGAGGEGGSVTVLAGPSGADEVLAAVEAEVAGARRIVLAPTRPGLRVERGSGA